MKVIPIDSRLSTMAAFSTRPRASKLAARPPIAPQSPNSHTLLQGSSSKRTPRVKISRRPKPAGRLATTSWVRHLYSNLYFEGRSLGQGTFGKVRLGTHILTGEKVAIKILEKDKIKDQSDVERVTREI